jgi:hypothetical protein
MRVRIGFVAALALLGACKKGRIEILGAGPEEDGRLTADLYTWDCVDGEETWMGTKGFDVALEFVPDEVSSRQLPAPGSCSYGLSMFAIDTVTEGAALVDLDGEPLTEDPGWRTETDEGVLEPLVDGLWFHDVMGNMNGCARPKTIAGDGVELVQAGILDGVITPPMGYVEGVSVSVDLTNGIPFGADAQISWNASNWTFTFVQLRRVDLETGELRETATCNTTGEGRFDLGSDLWGLMDPSLTDETTLNYVLVGFDARGVAETVQGQKIQVSTRELHQLGDNRQ